MPNNPRITDDGNGRIAVLLGDRPLRSYVYSAATQLAAMRRAREYVEGWCAARDHYAA